MSQKKCSCYGNWFSTVSVINVYCREVWSHDVSLSLDALTCAGRHSGTCELLDWVPGVVVDFVTNVKHRFPQVPNSTHIIHHYMIAVWSLQGFPSWAMCLTDQAHVVSRPVVSLYTSQQSLKNPVTQCWLGTLAVSHWPLETRLYTCVSVFSFP